MDLDQLQALVLERKDRGWVTIPVETLEKLLSGYQKPEPIPFGSPFITEA